MSSKSPLITVEGLNVFDVINSKIKEAGSKENMRSLGMVARKTIVSRTQKEGVDSSGSPFVKYSDSYKKRKERYLGRSVDKVDLTLTGQMFRDFKVQKLNKGNVEVGFAKGSRKSYLKAKAHMTGLAVPVRSFAGIGRNKDLKVLAEVVTKTIRNSLNSIPRIVRKNDT